MSSCPGIGASSTSETVRRLDCYIYILRAITPRSSPDANGEHHARRNAIAARNLRYLRPGANVSSTIRALSSCDQRRRRSNPAQNLDPHDDLKARLKVTRFAKYHASDKTALVGCVH
jgi:hypothetical protein